ncbi:amino acid ABC transporter permease [Oceanobacillus sp. 1P07AA]|uniref:amino acid ABC transporter permease n=1 Tax=Oceanobacillus sp. 1P07AA TaxID=3132293 RepID=UPI0039A52265
MSDTIDIISQLSRGLGITVSILIASAILAYFMAFFAGLCRLSSSRIVRVATGFYIEIFRGTSLIVQLFWLYYAIPIIFGIQLGNNWVIGVIAIGLNYGAYLSEVVRGSIISVDKGQTEAAVALNMSKKQRMRLIILPQAIRMMLPEFGNYTIQMLKGTSLVYLIGLTDILYYGNMMRNTNLDLSPLIYILVLVFYFLLALPLIWFTRKAEDISKKGVAS